MTVYEILLDKAHEEGLIVKEKVLQSSDGRIKNNRIAIRKSINSTAKKACVLAEELGHHHTSVGNILNQSDNWNRKQERQARLWAYNSCIGLRGLIRAYKHGCQDFHDTAKFLEVTEEFLEDCVDCYRDKYGTGVAVDDYYLMFIPYFTVGRII